MAILKDKMLLLSPQKGILHVKGRDTIARHTHGSYEGSVVTARDQSDGGTLGPSPQPALHMAFQAVPRLSIEGQVKGSA